MEYRIGKLAFSANIWHYNNLTYNWNSIGHHQREVNWLSHMGRKGQKWGVRNGPPYPLKGDQLAGYKKSSKSSWDSYKIKWGDEEDLHLVKGTKIHDPKVFAGKDGTKPLTDKKLDSLVHDHGGERAEWQHCKGRGTIDYHGEDREAEIHWFQAPKVGKHEFKVKKWLDD